MKLTESAKLKKILKYAKEESFLSEILENEIIAAYNKRGVKAVNILKNNKLFKIILNDTYYLWEVEGETQSYLVFNSHYCECKDFSIRVIKKGEKEPCYHLLAKIIGEKIGHYTEKQISHKEYQRMIDLRYQSN